MDWVWFLFGFDGRINRAKMWLAILVIVCWMLFIALLMLGIEQMFGTPVKSIHFNINDIFGIVDPAVLRAAFARLREGKEASPAHLVLAFFARVGTLIFVWVYLASLHQAAARPRQGRLVDDPLFRDSRPLCPVPEPAARLVPDIPPRAGRLLHDDLGFYRYLLPEGDAMDQPVRA